jgi:hypothetical protein
MATQSIDRRPKNLPIYLTAGDELPFRLRFKQANGTVFSLAGYTITAGVFVSRVNATATNPPAVGNEPFQFGVVRDDAAGTVDLTLTEQQTATLNSAAVLTWRWYFRWVSPGGITRTLISGPITAGLP